MIHLSCVQQISFLDNESAQYQTYHDAYQDAYVRRKETCLMMTEEYNSFLRDIIHGFPQSTGQKLLLQQLNEELTSLYEENNQKAIELFKLKQQEMVLQRQRQPNQK